MSSGPNILTTHYWSGERELATDDMLKIGVRSAIHGYYSHLYRMAATMHATATCAHPEQLTLGNASVWRRHESIEDTASRGMVLAFSRIFL